MEPRTVSVSSTKAAESSSGDVACVCVMTPNERTTNKAVSAQSLAQRVLMVVRA
jgi:hypothetical protein